MKQTRYLSLALAVGAIFALAIAGCGGSSGGSSSSGGGVGYGAGDSNSNTSDSTSSSGGYGSTTSTSAAAGVVVKTAKNPKLGKILVDSKGNTLYMFRKDKGGRSACYGKCAVAWPPVLTEGAAKAGSGASQGKLGVSDRTDGTTQVTYNGLPLYLYAGDTRPGETNGNDITQFGAQWYALNAAGGEAG